MPSNRVQKIISKRSGLSLRVSRGHFATSHSHINYYIDVTMQKSRLCEAQALARELVSYYSTSTLVDTILCLDGTEVIATCLAQELTSDSFMSMNAHKTICVVTPEHTTGSQLIFRENIAPAITGKHVLVLAASVTTGYTAQAAVEAINYYGGHVVGICAIFATIDTCAGFPVRAAFDTADLDEYASHPSHECPLCRRGIKIDALVNGFGYSKL